MIMFVSEITARQYLQTMCTGETKMYHNPGKFLTRVLIFSVVCSICLITFCTREALAKKDKPGLDSKFYLSEFYFDGNEYIGISRYPKIDKEISIICFFKPEKEAFKNNSSLICRWMETDGYQSYNVSLTDDYHVKIWLEICAEDSRINHNVGLTLGRKAQVDMWQHIALTYDGKDIKAYYNGVLDSDKIFSGSLISPKSPDLLLGAKENRMDFTKGNLFKGTLGNVYIFSRALSEAEIKVLYEQGLGHFKVDDQK